ncbi:MAG TPA: sulfocyanin-like copper-binding protein [Gemmatimonadales bacterium]|jgi:sulfocyanin|nr:sulfocyanin-like copper-binding protein [Gemmatimonadales bacterium]
MRATIRGFALVTLLYAATPRALRGQATPVKVDSSWMAVRAADSTVEFQLTAALTSDNGGMNFNGAARGALTLTVPVKWHVTLHFTNEDDNMPHSVEVTLAQKPLTATSGKPAFPRAESKHAAQGVNAGAKEDVRFTANQAGSYLIVCAVPGHEAAGMWIRLSVSATATRPWLQAVPAAP